MQVPCIELHHSYFSIRIVETKANHLKTAQKSACLLCGLNQC